MTENVSLSSINLDQLTREHVESALALNMPENLRPSEGVLLDYKLEVPNDLGDCVASLANTSGGLLIIGVETKQQTSKGNTKENIPISIPGALLPRDAKATLTQKIASATHPVPQFEIGLCEGSDPTRKIAVIRVLEGGYPPFESHKDGAQRIPDAAKTRVIKLRWPKLSNC